MKKVGILTINDNLNFGNRLQNYAVQEVLKFYGLEPFTIINNTYILPENKNCIIALFVKIYNKIKNIIRKFDCKRNERMNVFKKFNSNIRFYKDVINYKNIPLNFNDEFEFFVCGSDQIWNPNFKRMSDIDFLSFAEFKKRISFSASFGINHIPEELSDFYKKRLMELKNISVREENAKEMIKNLTGREDVVVLIDPTMMLTVEEWDKVCKKPKMLKNENYILNYFLGEVSENRQKEIERIAFENNCEIINILDKDSPFYSCGPSEFLWLEKNAFLICTDSFHSSVFAVLYNRPFIIFDRNQKGIQPMNSRLETLLSKFKLKNRKFEDKITKENLNHDYSEAYKILAEERKKSKEFLEKALDLK